MAEDRGASREQRVAGFGPVAEVYSATGNFAGTGLIYRATTYDERGNVTFASEPYAALAGEPGSLGTRFTGYDPLGRLTGKEVNQANGTTLHVAYTHSGFRTSIVAGSLHMHRVYDGLGRLVEIRDAMGGITRYAYDGAGNPIAFQDPNAALDASLPITTASYDAFGHKDYNAAGYLTHERDPVSGHVYARSRRATRAAK